MKKYIFLLSVVLSFLGCEKEMMDYDLFFSSGSTAQSVWKSGDMGACRYDVDTFLVVVGK